MIRLALLLWLAILGLAALWLGSWVGWHAGRWIIFLMGGVP